MNFVDKFRGHSCVFMSVKLQNEDVWKNNGGIFLPTIGTNALHAPINCFGIVNHARISLALTPFYCFELVCGCNRQFAGVILNSGHTPSIAGTIFNFLQT